MYNYLKSKIYFDRQVKYYINGFLFSIFLTIIPFFIARNHFFSYSVNQLIIIFCSFIQIIIHFIYFLHLNNIQKNYWYLISLLFIIIIMFIVVFGSIWIMFNLDHHLML